MQKFANNVLSALTTPVNDVSTLMVVASGNLFPVTTGGDHFLITLIALDQNGNEESWEICKVTFRDGNELTVLRAQEGTIAQLWAAGTRVELRLTAGSMVAPDDPRLSDAREWTGTTVTQVEAEAGTATTARKWTAQRVFQAITAWWSASAHKTKLDGIQAGAQVNAVTSVAGRTGAVVVSKADVGLGNVTNDAQLKIASNLSDLNNAATARTNLGLGTAAGANVTISDTDRTPGRLLKVGDFGLGATHPPSILDINDHNIAPGFYQYNLLSGSTNGAENYGTVLSIQATGNAANYGGWAPQMFFGTLGGVYVRFNTAPGSASWGTWQRVLTDQGGTVSGNVVFGAASSGATVGSNGMTIQKGSATGANTQLIVTPEDGALGRDSQILFGATFSDGSGVPDIEVRESGAIRYGASSGGVEPRGWSLRFLTGGDDSGDTPTERMRISRWGAIFQPAVYAPAFVGPLTGNAATATKLAAPVTINGIAFDGSANINIIERGSNSNGIYVRYADGTQICFAYFNGTSAVTTASGSSFVSPEIQWTFPASFSFANNITLSGSVLGTGTCGVLMGSACTVTGVMWRLHSSVSGTFTNPRVIAIGSWK